MEAENARCLLQPQTESVLAAEFHFRSLIEEETRRRFGDDAVGQLDDLSARQLEATRGLIVDRLIPFYMSCAVLLAHLSDLELSSILEAE